MNKIKLLHIARTVLIIEVNDISLCYIYKQISISLYVYDAVQTHTYWERIIIYLYRLNKQRELCRCQTWHPEISITSTVVS